MLSRQWHIHVHARLSRYYGLPGGASGKVPNVSTVEGQVRGSARALVKRQVERDQRAETGRGIEVELATGGLRPFGEMP